MQKPQLNLMFFFRDFVIYYSCVDETFLNERSHTQSETEAESEWEYWVKIGRSRIISSTEVGVELFSHETWGWSQSSESESKYRVEVPKMRKAAVVVEFEVKAGDGKK